MKIFNSLEEIKDIEETVVALGNFDGVTGDISRSSKER